MDFIPSEKNSEVAIFAGGCFWGVEYFMEKQKGIISVESGYIGGTLKNPTYEIVSSETSGYAEAVQVIFDPSLTNYEALAQLFFEIHDPTQIDGQGPDIGEQYQSAIFYYNDEQLNIAKHVIAGLEKNGYEIATKLIPVTTFWPAEDYHQQYYAKNHQQPYCHHRVKRL